MSPSQDLTLPTSERKQNYCLTGLVNHIGETIREGHYVALIPYNDYEWMVMDDSETYITQEPPGDVYIILYTKVAEQH